MATGVNKEKTSINQQMIGVRADDGNNNGDCDGGGGLNRRRQV
jgi:hypothetical protein